MSRLEIMERRLNRHKDVAETYIPLGFIKVSSTKMGFAPSFLNYIFVRSTFQALVRLKSDKEQFEPLRFVMHPVFDEKYERHNEVLTMSDKEMEDFMRVTREENEKVIFLENMKYATKASREVQITKGEFAGVIGRIKRIKGYRCVVLTIGNEMAAAVIDVPNSHLRYLTDKEMERQRIQDKISKI